MGVGVGAYMGVGMNRVGQNRIYTPYMTVYFMISLPKIPYIHRIYMVLANPRYEVRYQCGCGCECSYGCGCACGCTLKRLPFCSAPCFHKRIAMVPFAFLQCTVLPQTQSSGAVCLSAVHRAFTNAEQWCRLPFCSAPCFHKRRAMVLFSNVGHYRHSAHNTYAWTHTHARTHTHTHAYTHMHAHTRTHTNTHARSHFLTSYACMCARRSWCCSATLWVSRPCPKKWSRLRSCTF